MFDIRVTRDHSDVIRAIPGDFKSYFRMHEWRVKHNTKKMSKQRNKFSVTIVLALIYVSGKEELLKEHQE